MQCTLNILQLPACDAASAPGYDQLMCYMVDQLLQAPHDTMHHNFRPKSRAADVLNNDQSV